MRRRWCGVAAASATAMGVLVACAAPPEQATLPDDRTVLEYVLDELSAAGLSPEEQTALLAAQEREREDVIAACMQQNGFEYTPYLTVEDNAKYDSQWSPDDRAWVTQYGYGYTDAPGKAEREQAEARGELDNPNDSYRFSLSPAEDRAYLEVYAGVREDSSSTETDGGGEVEWEDAGCSGQGHLATANALDTIWMSAEYRRIEELLDDSYVIVARDERMVQLEQAWSDCMADSGFPGLSGQGQGRALFLTGVDGLSDPNAPEVIDDRTVAREREIAIAVADFDCRDATDYEKVRRTVRVDVEREILADNDADVQALLFLVQSLQASAQ